MVAVRRNLVLDPVRAAADAGLRWITDDTPGLRRLGSAKRFRYVDARGKAVREAATLSRIRGLAIPPAWRDVWICASPNGHMQATGRDARGRKQYRYHARWREKRDETKYDRMLFFGLALPKIRARVDDDLGRPGLPREKILATIVRLLETTLIRVGNEEYARDNGSYGLTTLRSKHVDVDGSELRFEFRGKSGVRRKVALRDRRLARIIRHCQDLPGHELFQYVDDDGEYRTIDSQDVNEYLRTIARMEITAKDFRTWNGTVLAAAALCAAAQSGGEPTKREVVRCIEEVAARLGNTKSVCRKCYVHPKVIDSYLDGTLLGAIGGSDDVEGAVLKWLRTLY